MKHRWQRQGMAFALSLALASMPCFQVFAENEAEGTLNSEAGIETAAPEEIPVPAGEILPDAAAEPETLAGILSEIPAGQDPAELLNGISEAGTLADILPESILTSAAELFPEPEEPGTLTADPEVPGTEVLADGEELQAESLTEAEEGDASLTEALPEAEEAETVISAEEIPDAPVLPAETEEIPDLPLIDGDAEEEETPAEAPDALHDPQEEEIAVGEEPGEEPDDGQGEEQGEEQYPYNIFFTDLRSTNGDNWTIVYKNETDYIVGLDVSELTAAGEEGYEIRWHCGCFTDPGTYTDWVNKEGIIYPDTSGLFVRIDGAAAAADEHIMLNGGFWTEANIWKGEEHIARDSFWVEPVDPVLSYNIPDWNRNVLPYWDQWINRYENGFVSDANHVWGGDFLVELSGLTVVNENEEAPSVIIEHEDENGWNLRPTENMGYADVSYTFTDENGEQKPASFRIFVSGDVFDVWIDTPQNFNQFRPGATMNLTAESSHSTFSPEEGHQILSTENVTYEWSIAEGAELVSLEAEGNTANVTAGEEDGFVLVHVKAYDLNPETGEKELAGETDMDLWVSSDFTYLLPGSLPSDLQLGESLDLKPEYIHQYFDEESETYVSEAFTNVRYRFNYDENAFLIRDANGETVRPEEYTEGCYGADAVFSITRRAVYSTNIFMAVEVLYEDGMYYEEWSRDYWFEDLPRNAWFEADHRDEWGNATVFTTQEDYTITLVTEGLGDTGLSVEWTAGSFTDPQEFESFTAIEGLLTVAPDGMSAVVNPGLALTDEIIQKNNGHIYLWADIYQGDIILGSTDMNINIAEPQYNYHFPGDMNVLPFWDQWIPRTMNADIFDENHPDWENVNIEIRNLTVANEDEENPTVILDNEDENGWNLHPTETPGFAVVSFDYTDALGEDQSYSFRINMYNDVFDAWISVDNDVDMYQPGSYFTVYPNASHQAFSEEEGHHDVSTENVTFEWVFDQGEELVEAEYEGDCIHLTAGEEEGDILLRLLAFDLDPETGERFQAGESNRWFHIWSDYTVLLPGELEKDNLKLGESITINPDYIHYYRDDAGAFAEEELANVRFRVDFDPEMLAVSDKDGNELGWTEEGFTYTDACYGTDVSFIVTKKVPEGTNIHVTVEREREDGSYSDDWGRDYWFGHNDEEYVPEPEVPHADITVTGVKAESAGKNSVLVSWDEAEGAEGYIVFRKVGADGEAQLAGIVTDGLSFLDKNASGKVWNFYLVVPYATIDGQRACGDYDGYAYAYGRLPRTQNLRTTAQTSKGVTIAWDENEGADGYIVYRSIGGKHFSYLYLVTGKTSFTDLNASADEYNFYRVYPFFTNEDGSRTATISPAYCYGKKETAEAPAPVKEVSAENAQLGDVDVSWTASAGAEGYLVYAKRGNGDFVKIAETAETSYTDQEAEADVYNYYIILPWKTGASGRLVAQNTTYGFVWNVKPVIEPVLND